MIGRDAVLRSGLVTQITRQYICIVGWCTLLAFVSNVSNMPTGVEICQNRPQRGVKKSILNGNPP